jgi:hypothetical protein
MVRTGLKRDIGRRAMGAEFVSLGFSQRNHLSVRAPSALGVTRADELAKFVNEHAANPGVGVGKAERLLCVFKRRFDVELVRALDFRAQSMGSQEITKL